MTAIAQAYFHISPFDLEALPLDAAGEIATTIALADAEEVFARPAEITVELDEGSLKGWITVGNLAASIFSSSAATLTTINNYPVFKMHLHQMVVDARTFASKQTTIFKL